MTSAPAKQLLSKVVRILRELILDLGVASALGAVILAHARSVPSHASWMGGIGVALMAVARVSTRILRPLTPALGVHLVGGLLTAYWLFFVEPTFLEDESLWLSLARTGWFVAVRGLFILVPLWWLAAMAQARGSVSDEAERDVP